jgi:hypothetical protein
MRQALGVDGMHRIAVRRAKGHVRAADALAFMRVQPQLGTGRRAEAGAIAALGVQHAAERRPCGAADTRSSMNPWYTVRPPRTVRLRPSIASPAAGNHTSTEPGSPS